MAQGRDLTPYQKGVIKRYYENKDNLMAQKLSEIVSELYVCTDEKHACRLWERARKALANMEVNKQTVKWVCEKRDLETLAEVVSELF